MAKMVISKCKLNKCAHCNTNTNLVAVFDINGRLYFVCLTHNAMLELMEKSFEEAVERNHKAEIERELRMAKFNSRQRAEIPIISESEYDLSYN